MIDNYKYYKIWYGSEEGWEYYRLHSDNSYAFWHKEFRTWIYATSIPWEARIIFHDEVEISKLEMLVMNGSEV